MAIRKKRDRTQEQLDQLRDIRGQAAASIPALEDALRSTSNYVVAKVAAIIEDEALRQMTSQLLAAFDRFMPDAPRIDKGCAATTAIVKALSALDYRDPAPYRRGIRHHQNEGLGPLMSPQNSAVPAPWGSHKPTTTAPWTSWCCCSPIPKRPHGSAPLVPSDAATMQLESRC